MILPHSEILLVVGLVGLYLYDSTLLLSCNDGVLTPSWGSKWSIFFGSERFQVRGKEPLLPNPFLPHRPLYRLSWQTEGVIGPVPQWTPPENVYAPLAPLVWCMVIALFWFIPLGLFSRFGDLSIATGIILFYTSALTALGWIWIKRDMYQCTGKRLISLTIESLTCPPFALNLIRHLSLTVPISEDLLSAGRRLLPKSEWAQAVDQIINRVDNEVAWEEEGTARARALLSHRQQLRQEGMSCRLLNL